MLLVINVGSLVKLIDIFGFLKFLSGIFILFSLVKVNIVLCGVVLVLLF